MITTDMLHTVLRPRENGESIEDIRPDLINPAGQRKGHYLIAAAGRPDHHRSAISARFFPRTTATPSTRVQLRTGLLELSVRKRPGPLGC